MDDGTLRYRLLQQRRDAPRPTRLSVSSGSRPNGSEKDRPLTLPCLSQRYQPLPVRPRRVHHRDIVQVDRHVHIRQELADPFEQPVVVSVDRPEPSATVV